MRKGERSLLDVLTREEYRVQGELSAFRHIRQRQVGIADLPDKPVVDLYDGAQEAALYQHQETLLGRLAQRSWELAEVRERILGGSYGICADCGLRIPPRRLKALPTATLCVACQERREAVRAAA